MRIRGKTIAAFFGVSLLLAPQMALADASVPTADIDGATDNSLAKRYEGSFIVSYEKSTYTDFMVPLSPLVKSSDPDAREQNNNRVFAPEKTLEVEGALTRIT